MGAFPYLMGFRLLVAKCLVYFCVLCKRRLRFIVPLDAHTVGGNTSVVGSGIFFTTGERFHEWNTLFDPPFQLAVFRNWQYSATGSAD